METSNTLIHQATASVAPKFDAASFEQFCSLVYDQSGILLSEKKRSLVEARLGKRLRQLKLGSLRDYLKVLSGNNGHKEMVQMLNLISTNVTSFYREADHFKVLHECVDRWAAQGMRKLRVWCAAASTGEEPYTLAITIMEAAKGRIPDIKILGTDISTNVLEKCGEAVYEDSKVQPVPEDLRKKYFTVSQSSSGARLWHVKDELKKLMLFRRMNLIRTPFPMKGPMDVVFCRNVMIYFDNATRKKLLGEVERLLKPGGYLMVGHSESLAGSLCDLERIAPSTYRKSGGAQ